MPIQIQLRKAEIDDKDHVYALICQLVGFDFDRNRFEKTYKKNLSDEKIRYWVIDNGEKVIGFVSLHFQDLLHHEGSVAEIQELCVDEKFTGKGFGKLLADHAISEAKKLNCEIIELSVNNKRVNAHRFYERECWERSHFKFTKKL